MLGLSLWHWLILLVTMALPAIGALVVVLRLKAPVGPNRYGAVSEPAASGQALVRGFRRIAVFGGRATRSEFWWLLFWAALIYGIALAVGWGAADLEGGQWPIFISVDLLPLIFNLPLLSATVRRLQDANRSGLWVLLILGGTSAIALVPLLIEPARGDD